MGVLHSENLGVYQQLTVAQSNRGPQHSLSRLVGVAVVWTSRYRMRKGAMTFWENVKLLTALDPVNIEKKRSSKCRKISHNDYERSVRN